MFVEDLNAVGKNITAEIPEEHAVHFKEMCKLFALINAPEHDAAIDEYLLKLSLARSPNANANAMNTNSVPPLMERSVRDPRIREKEPLRAQSIVDPRASFELEIFTVVVQFIYDLDPAMKLFPFGSTQYGIKYPNANYNLLVTTGEFFDSAMNVITELQKIDCIYARFFRPKSPRTSESLVHFPK